MYSHDIVIVILGQSVNSVNTRCIQHRSGIRTGNEPKFVKHHFTKVHQPSDLRITPLCTVKSDDTNTSTRRKSLMEQLRAKENEYMLQLNTLFPYGLNDRLEKPKYMDAEEQFLQGACIYKIFPIVVTSGHSKGSSKVGKDTPRQFDADNTLQHLVSSYNTGNLHQCRTTISKLNVSDITILGQQVTTIIPTANGLVNSCYLMIKDLCNHFRTRSVTYDNFLKNNYKLGQKIDVESRDFIPINFISKEIEDLGLSNILNDPDVCNSFPSKRLSNKFSNTDFRFTISHKHQNSIRSDICNYKPNIVSEAPERGHTCHCNLYSQFINHDVGHVVTGDVNIVANKRLRKLFKKGFSFVEPIFRNKSEIFSSLKCDIYNYASKLSAK